MTIQEIFDMYQEGTKIDNIYKRITNINAFCDNVVDLKEVEPLKEYLKDNPDSLLQSDFHKAKTYNKGIKYQIKFPVDDIPTDEYAFNLFFNERDVKSFIESIVENGPDCKFTTGTLREINEIIQQISEHQYSDRITINNNLYNKYKIFKTNGKVRNDFKFNMEDFKQLLLKK